MNSFACAAKDDGEGQAPPKRAFTGALAFFYVTGDAPPYDKMMTPPPPHAFTKSHVRKQKAGCEHIVAAADKYLSRLNENCKDVKHKEKIIKANDHCEKLKELNALVQNSDTNELYAKALKAFFDCMIFTEDIVVVKDIQGGEFTVITMKGLYEIENVLDKCPVCLEKVNMITTQECHHKVCETCIGTIRAESTTPTCPVCRHCLIPANANYIVPPGSAEIGTGPFYHRPPLRRWPTVSALEACLPPS